MVSKKVVGEIKRLRPLKKVGLPDYQVSDCGRVFNRFGKELSPDTSNGYKRVSLSKGGIQTKHFVHVLVALHYCRNYCEGFVANHKDHNKMNNHYKNLEWVTQSVNIKKYFTFKKRKVKLAKPIESV